MAQTVLHKRSTVVDKQPTSGQCSYGELIINYASGDGKSFFSTRKADDTIAQFHEDKYWETYVAKAIEESKSSYVLQIDDNGIVSCVKDGSEEGFVINDEGVVSLG